MMVSEFWKSQTFWSLPVYTGDVSGVCSALYELGGMVVMHDPSGCNSTYNTHDEIRWSSMESLIFLSGLTQLDAITGNDQKLVDDIVSAADEFHPKFIAIANSPVPWLIATDFAAICRKVKEEAHIPVFHVETNAMHDYTFGAGKAFLQAAKMLFSSKVGVKKTEAKETGIKDTGGKEVRENRKEYSRLTDCSADKDGRYSEDRIRVNILGMTPLDFTIRSDAENLQRELEKRGFEVVSNWALSGSLEKMKDALSADVNLVVSSVGIETARWMEETFDIPYTAGVPVGAFSPYLFSALRSSARKRISCAAYLPILEQCDLEQSTSAGGQEDRRCAAGESVTMGSIAAHLTLQDHRPCDLIPLTETVKGLIPEHAPRPQGEQQIREVLSGYEEVTADPMLQGACRSGCQFHDLPHFALSGRLYLDRIKSFITKDGRFSCDVLYVPHPGARRT